MNTFNIFFLLIALCLIVSILLQQRGAGLGEAFGGTGGVYSSRRGAERALYNLTVLLSILFILFGGISVYQRRVKVPKPNEQVLEQAASTPDGSTSSPSTSSPAITPTPDTKPQQ